MTAVTTDLGIANLALSMLGHEQIAAIDATTKAGRHIALHFDSVRDALLRSHPWNFALWRAKPTRTTKTITGITAVDNPVVTAVAHGLATGAYVRVGEITGMSQINGQASLITVLGVDTFSMDDIDASAYTAYASGGVVYTDTPRFEYAYAFNLPSDPYCLKVIRTSIEACGWEHDYRIEGRRLLTDEDDFSLEYIKRATTVTDYDALFVQAFALSLAIPMCMPLADNASLLDRLESKLERMQLTGQSVDGQEGAARATIDTDSWLRARA